MKTINSSKKIHYSLTLLFFCLHLFFFSRSEAQFSDPAQIYDTEELKILREKEGFTFNVFKTKEEDTIIIIGEKHIVEKSKRLAIKEITKRLEAASLLEDVKIYHEDPYYYELSSENLNLKMSPEEAKRAGGGALFLVGGESSRPLAIEDSGIIGEMSRCGKMTSFPLEIGLAPPVEIEIRKLVLEIKKLNEEFDKLKPGSDEADELELKIAVMEAKSIRIADGNTRPKDGFQEEYDQRGRRMGETLAKGKGKVRYAIVGLRHVEEIINTLKTLEATPVKLLKSQSK